MLLWIWGLRAWARSSFHACTNDRPAREPEESVGDRGGRSASDYLPTELAWWHARVPRFRSQRGETGVSTNGRLSSFAPTGYEASGCDPFCSCKSWVAFLIRPLQLVCDERISWRQYSRKAGVRGRNGACGPPPAQIPASGATAPGSCLGSNAQTLLGIGMQNSGSREARIRGRRLRDTVVLGSRWRSVATGAAGGS